jgi:hypothetical protein
MNHFFLGNFNFEFHQRLGQVQLQTLHQGLFKKFCLLPKWPSSIGRFSQIWRFKTFFSHFCRLETLENTSFSKILISLFGEIWLDKIASLFRASGPTRHCATAAQFGEPATEVSWTYCIVCDMLYRVRILLAVCSWIGYTR